MSAPLFFALLFWLSAWGVNVALANAPGRDSRGVRIVVPLLFGAALIVLWEGLVRHFEVLPVILPAPSVVWGTFLASTEILWVDFQ